MESLILAYSDNVGLIVAACITGSFTILALLMTWFLNKVKVTLRSDIKDVHEEVRTNHGVRNGARLEQISDDIAQMKRTMVTKTDLEEHSQHDLMVAADLRQEHAESVEALRKENADTREILLSALQIRSEDEGKS